MRKNKITALTLVLVLFLLSTNIGNAEIRCIFYQASTKDFAHQFILYEDVDDDKTLLFKELKLDKKTGEWINDIAKDEKVKTNLSKLSIKPFEERYLNAQELDIFKYLTSVSQVNINLNEARISSDGEMFKLKYKDNIISVYINDKSIGRLLKYEKDMEGNSNTYITSAI